MAQSSLLLVAVAAVAECPLVVALAERRAGRMAPAETVKVRAVTSVLLALVGPEESVGWR